MKILRYVVLSVLALGLTGVANATNFRLLDPTGSQGNFPAINPTGSNPFSFYDCTFITGDGCFGAVNDTAFNITSFSATITANVPISSLDCPTDAFSGLNSAFTDAPICTFSGDTMTVVFSGGPGVAPGSTIWITEDDIPDSDFDPGAGSFTVTTAAATPEPSSIWMALTGMGSLGYLLRRRRGSSC
jgi:hypothetical protein